MNKKTKIFSTIISLIIITSLLNIFFSIKLVKDESMLPTLYNGDILLCINFFDITNNNIYGFNLKNNTFVKRLLYKNDSLQNVFLEIINGNIYIDHSLFKNYNSYNESLNPVMINKNECFFIGDNLNNSIDSRIFGNIKLNSINFRVIMVLYPFKRFGLIK